MTASQLIEEWAAGPESEPTVAPAEVATVPSQARQYYEEWFAARMAMVDAHHKRLIYDAATQTMELPPLPPPHPADDVRDDTFEPRWDLAKKPKSKPQPYRFNRQHMKRHVTKMLCDPYRHDPHNPRLQVEILGYCLRKAARRKLGPTKSAPWFGYTGGYYALPILSKYKI